MSEEDYSSLPLEDKLVHKVWKVRLEGYEEITKQFQNSRNENDPCFQRYNQEPSLFKKFVTDANVVAQETAIASLLEFLQYGGTPANAQKLKSAGVISSLCEKGLSSSRAGTKTKSVEVLLLFVEVSNDAGLVVEDILPFLTHRLPKLVAGCVGALASMVENFGTIVPAKLIIPTLSKLFGHADRNVRAEATKLTVELYKWMGDGLTVVLFPDLKPVQQKDLTSAFEKVKGEPVEQIRLTRSQQAARKQAEEQDDVEMEEAATTVEESLQAFDPFEMLDPINVLSKFPSDLNERITSAKWKDRKEVLDEVVEVLAKSPKLVVTDYSEFVKILAKCMKDANIQVVQLAANSVEFLAKGLKRNFAKYQPLLLGPMLERTKEKKPSVADALNNALDSLFKITGISEILDETLNSMKHKTPQIKIASTNYLQRCLTETTEAPSSNEIDSIISQGVKLLSDSQEPIRQAATEMIGTLMKITGERELNPFLDKIDDNRKAKVKKFYETVAVKAKTGAGSASASASAVSKTKTIRESSTLGPNRLSGIKPKIPAPGQTIPSKRTATSPAKRADDSQKLATSRSLTGRSLLSTKHLHFAPAIPPNPVVKRDVVSEEQLEELRTLRKEKQEWLAEKERFLQIQKDFQNDKQMLNQEINHLRHENESVSKIHTNSELMNKQKDVQILRLKSDLENSKLKIRDLEQTIEMIKLEQNQQAHNIPSQSGPQFASPHKIVEHRQTSDSGITSGELSSRVHGMSIEGEAAKENAFSPVHSTRISPQKFSDNTNTFSNFNSLSKDVVADDESWRRAAEVTSQLKARIEKMKARSRTVKSGI